MAVVINEFEVVAEPQQASQQADTPAQDTSAKVQVPTTQDIERIVRRQLERCARVRAY
jgi:hypothetical protein